MSNLNQTISRTIKYADKILLDIDNDKAWMFRPDVPEPYHVYLAIRNGKLAHVCQVDDGPSEHVVWHIKGNKMTKVYDFQARPF